MPLDLHDWVGEEQQFGGLYKLSDNLQRNKQIEEQRKYREQQDRNRDEARQSSDTQFFTNYLNKKDNLTGTLYDRNINDLLGSALKQAYTLSSQKVPLGNIMMAVQPLVEQVNTYQSKAKMYSAQKKEVLENLKPFKGYNLQAISDEMDKMAFYDTDTKTGQPTLNVDKADPNHNYALDVIRYMPDKVTDSSSIDDIVKSYEANTIEGVRKYTNAKGGSEYRKTEITAAPYMVNEGGEVVPKYEIAKDGDAQVEHLFDNGNGGKEKHPVRLVDQDVYLGILRKYPAMADYLKGQVKVAGQGKADLFSEQSNHAARAVLYNLLKENTQVKYKDVQANKENPIRSTTNNYFGGGTVGINDVYGGIENKVNFDVENLGGSKNKRGEIQKVYTRANALDADAAAIVTKMVQDVAPGSKLGIDDLYLHKDDNGKISIYRTDDEEKIVISDKFKLVTMPRVGTNLKAQPSVQEKRVVIGQGNSNKAPNKRKGKFDDL